MCMSVGGWGGGRAGANWRHRRENVEKHGETRVCGGARIVGFGWMGGQQQNGA